MKRRRLIGLSVWSAVVALVGCGQITGLSDTYTYGDDASVTGDGGAGDGGNGSDGPSTTDAPTTDAKTDAPTAACLTDFQSLGLQDAPTDCKTCIVAHCCTDVTPCAKDSSCKDIMSCIDGCQSKQSGSQEKRSCIQNCTQQFNVAYNNLSGCIETDCATAQNQTCSTLLK